MKQAIFVMFPLRPMQRGVLACSYRLHPRSLQPHSALGSPGH
jgi:hypothetical protein